METAAAAKRYVHHDLATLKAPILRLEISSQASGNFWTPIYIAVCARSLGHTWTNFTLFRVPLNVINCSRLAWNSMAAIRRSRPHTRVEKSEPRATRLAISQANKFYSWPLDPSQKLYDKLESVRVQRPQTSGDLGVFSIFLNRFNSHYTIITTLY